MIKNTTYYIVDDDKDDQEFLMKALKANDTNVRCVSSLNGKSAIHDLNNTTDPLPDAIFLDLNMPQFTGKQCLAELKRTPSLQHIPVVIYSTTSFKKEINDLMEMGASHFITKKSDFKELCEELSIITSELNELHSTQ